MHIVYLDQNKWIELSKTAHGLHTSHDFTEVLDFVRGARDMKLACFPISFAHHMETHKSRNLERRARLAGFMRDLSGGTTIADSGPILRHEIDTALGERFQVRPGSVRPLRLLGKGVFHAAGRPGFKLGLGSEFDTLPPRTKQTIQALLEEGMLSGVMPFTGESAPRADLSGPEKNFQNHLNALAERLSSLDPATRDRVFYFIAMRDILNPLRDALSRHAISWDDFEAMGQQGWMDFMDDLPTQRVDMHLHRVWAKNKQLLATRTELVDWGQLGPMVAYCDVVVMEKKFANLVTRDGFQPHARVLTDLRQLPQTLLSLPS